MRRVKFERARGAPSVWAIAVLGLCVAASMFINFRASAQGTEATPPGQTSQSTRPPKSAAEESATIQDDETLIPDDKESADNNVTFPIDI